MTVGMKPEQIIITHLRINRAPRKEGSSGGLPMTGTAFAKAAGISQAVISKVEAGLNGINFETALKIRNFMKDTVSDWSDSEMFDVESAMRRLGEPTSLEAAE